MEAALQVDVEHAVELLVGVIEDALSDVDTRGADDSVELSDIREGSLDLAEVANIENGGIGLSAQLDDAITHGLQPVLVDVESHDARPLLRGSERHRFSNPGRRTNDGNDAVIQSKHRDSFS